MEICEGGEVKEEERKVTGNKKKRKRRRKRKREKKRKMKILKRKDSDAGEKVAEFQGCPIARSLTGMFTILGLCSSSHAPAATLMSHRPSHTDVQPRVEATSRARVAGAGSRLTSGFDQRRGAWSVSIIPECEYVVFNTAKLSAMLPSNGLEGLQWDVFAKKAGIWGASDFTNNELLDHGNTTKGTTDHLWYTTSLQVDVNDEILKKNSFEELSSMKTA
ncbi:beta-galactosidase, partial [Striga asiatica]